MANARIRAEGAKVIVSIPEGEMPPEAARAIGRALLLKAQEAEEYAKHNQLILDGALALRVGIPIGFSNNPKIMSEVRKEAQSNRDLRRYHPGGIRSKEQFGLPTLTQTAPKVST